MPINMRLSLNLEGVKEKLIVRQQYDEIRSLVNLFRVKGTAVWIVFKSPAYWFICLTHWIAYTIRSIDNCANDDKEKVNCGTVAAKLNKYPLAMGDLLVVNALCSLLVVFYTGSCFNRYTSIYNQIIALHGKLHNISLYLRAFFRSSDHRCSCTSLNVHDISDLTFFKGP
eukprot:749332-Hanusia_phi.AAC.4